MAVGIPPDLTNAPVAVKKAVVPLLTTTTTTTPSTGEIWPRGAKNTAG